MSKRLRTSLASKRGRMLRPRSSSLPPPAVEEDESVVGEALASEPEELSPAPAEVIVVARAAVGHFCYRKCAQPVAVSAIEKERGFDQRKVEFRERGER